MKYLLGFVAIAVIGVVAWLWWPCPEDDNDDDWAQHMQNYKVTYLDVGLTAAEREAWHRTPEGSEMLPLSFLACLEDAETGKRFIHVMERFGFLPDPGNKDELPIGWSAVDDKIFGIPVRKVGLNCAACHTGQIEYKGSRLRIDGAPNLVAVEAFAKDLRGSIEGTLKSPSKAFKFLRRVIKYHHDAKVGGEFLEVSPETLAFLDEVDADETSGEDEDTHLTNFLGATFAVSVSTSPDDLVVHPMKVAREERAMKARVWQDNLQAAHDAFRTGYRSTEGDPTEVDLKHVGNVVATIKKFRDYVWRRVIFIKRLDWAMKNETPAGPGRADSFDLIRDLLFSKEHHIPMTAPVSIPELFSLGDYEFIHWDANTNSVMQRNIAQAVALGADLEPDTHLPHVYPRKLHVLEVAAKKMNPPKWPAEVFGPLDSAKVARGEEVFEKNCHGCHGKESYIDVEIVGTDPERLITFNKPLLGIGPFYEALGDLARDMEKAVFAAHGITGNEAQAMKGSNPHWRATNTYTARPLKGVWSTAPYLHNGSVPTLYDLLQPPAKRPAGFPVGHREFDPVKVGYRTDPAEEVWHFNSSIKGNSNRGHQFGTTLSEGEKWALIEYLKSR